MLLEKHFQVLPIRTTILTYPDTYFLVSQECPYVLSYQANGADKRGLYKQIKSNRANKQNQTWKPKTRKKQHKKQKTQCNKTTTKKTNKKQKQKLRKSRFWFYVFFFVVFVVVFLFFFFFFLVILPVELFFWWLCFWLCFFLLFMSFAKQFFLCWNRPHKSWVWLEHQTDSPCFACRSTHVRMPPIIKASVAAIFEEKLPIITGCFTETIELGQYSKSCGNPSKNQRLRIDTTERHMLIFLQYN